LIRYGFLKSAAADAERDDYDNEQAETPGNAWWSMITFSLASKTKGNQAHHKFEYQ
jgi:hypothetical protein